MRLNGGRALYAYVPNPATWLDPFGLAGDPEVYYRTMKPKHYERLQRTGKVPVTGETSTTQSQAYAERYNGVTVEFQMKPGTTDALRGIGVSDGTRATASAYPELTSAGENWGMENARFKAERGQITVALGKGKALDVFNENIISQQEISRRGC